MIAWFRGARILPAISPISTRCNNAGETPALRQIALPAHRAKRLQALEPLPRYPGSISDDQMVEQKNQKLDQGAGVRMRI